MAGPCNSHVVIRFRFRFTDLSLTNFCYLFACHNLEVRLTPLLPPKMWHQIQKGNSQAFAGSKQGEDPFLW
jgi:hypothetical protein